jgi:ribosomal protein RSM22 (predicted rRNA methylase)
LGQLPVTVRQALDRLLDGRSRRDLSDRSAAITAQYRRCAGSDGVVRSEDDALAYAVARMPATYVAMAHALDQLALAAPGLTPATLLDIGCGPGTAAIAAIEAYPSLGALELVDRNKPLLALAGKLAPLAAADRDVRLSPLDIRARDSLPAADLVTAGYVFAELRETDLRERARGLWASARIALVITEPGTPAGFQRIRTIRDLLIADGAHVAAPCTHAAPCPMTDDGWCRVPIRVERSRDHRMLKGGVLGYEDEPVAYLALTRHAPTTRPAARIVAEPQVSKAGIAVLACTSGKLADIHAPSRDREKLRCFKKLRWGDATPIQEPDV